MQNCEIYIGDLENPSFYFNNATEYTGGKSKSTLMSTQGINAVDLVGNEMSIDTFGPSVHYIWHARRALKPTDYDGLTSTDGYVLCGYYNDSPSDIPYGTPVWYVKNGQPSGKYYFDHAERIGRDTWAIHAVSIIGLLDLQPHRGGVYTGEAFAEVLTEFFGGSVGESANGFTPLTGGLVDCQIADAVATTTVHGYLPFSESKRANLHQLMFAYIVNLTKADNGDLIFSYLTPNAAPPFISNDRIYIGGKINYEQPVTDVELEEFTYIYDETAEPVVVYDNSTAPHTEGEGLVTFDTPINPSTITTTDSLTVRDANETSAYVSGHGTISAIPYQIQKRILTRSTNTSGIRQSKSITGVGLVNPLNSSNLMDKLYEFYTQRKIVNASLVVENEKAGGLYSFVSPYDEEIAGFIQKMTWNATGITRADCEIVTGYTPTGVSTNMQNVVLLTGAGTWTVPPAVKQRDNPFIRAVLIQGGQGGHGGYSGESSQRRPDSPGAGGNGGEGGHGGKVLTVDIDVTSIDSFEYFCGGGGRGGGSDLPGREGGETTFGEYTSAAGAIAPGGILNLIDGKFYARSGKPGIAGAAGGIGAQPAAHSPTGEELAAYGGNGESVTLNGRTWTGGKGGRTNNASAGGYAGWAFGGGGGGAAAGNQGENGSDGYVEWTAVIGGKGGTGANASIPGDAAQFVGTGGNGGHGGGGGGAPGAAGFSGGSAPTGYEGEGGYGSTGGSGAGGGILIYF